VKNTFVKYENVFSPVFLCLESVLFCFLLFVAAPLVNVKKAISQIKSEITGMDVRVGVLEHSLLQARLRDKNLLQQDMNAPLHALV
jgi:hypothetical protein